MNANRRIIVSAGGLRLCLLQNYVKKTAGSIWAELLNARVETSFGVLLPTNAQVDANVISSFGQHSVPKELTDGKH